MRKLPPLRALHAFEAAARHHSFTAAANELGVTPTAISHQIRQLEEACGIRLFQRRPRPLLLTSAGARLYPALRNGFDALASAVALLAEQDVQAPLRVTSPSAFASKWLVPQLPKWREENPTVPLEIIGTDAVLDVRAGAADVAICSDVVVSNELRSGLLVKPHPLSLPGYGFYLVSMAHSPRTPVIEAFSTWMRAIIPTGSPPIKPAK
jgi:DNA-binding transcriptional LysR family regulator